MQPLAAKDAPRLMPRPLGGHAESNARDGARLLMTPSNDSSWPKIDEGLAELHAGEGIPHYEVKRRLGETTYVWSRPADGLNPSFLKYGMSRAAGAGAEMAIRQIPFHKGTKCLTAVSGLT